MSLDLAQTALAGGAGFATVASPCVLPLLPAIVGISTQGGRLRPLAIVLGFVLSFAGVALLFGASAQVLGLSAQALRDAAAIALLITGVLMLWPPLADRLMASLSRPLGWFTEGAQRLGAQDRGGLGGGVLLGASLGVLWTPCAGPVLASILALAAGAGTPAQSAPLLLAYAAGAGLPMLALAHGGRWATTRLRPLARHAGRLRQAFGTMVVATAAAMLAQVDTQAAAWLARTVSSAATSAGEALVPAAQAAPVDVGEHAPEFTGLGPWINSPPLSLAQLKGKVVLVDFWTYACVNCIRTLPHLQQLHERYARQGLVIVGVHSPEFAFERDTDNVRAAIKRHGLTYAVAQDNGFATWTAWRNLYWPAQYLVGPDGRVVMRHFGEGGEAALDAAIQRLLAR
ncbi:cytochrome c biogenesis protein DipZ [Aquabacterium soli]|uniref:Cytochrome c biogenesis protein DipZ n=1 Tax=Aquabacterium soli TaxID=2493092 RepID=A0A3R8TQR3_9BURK|nr:cytochrome c biogenesis protein DipZ [Aquabacterium soli]RRS02720.1 cytochrome c biogenesis protein DipZ [Aquabacterium soli]